MSSLRGLLLLFAIFSLSSLALCQDHERNEMSDPGLMMNFYKDSCPQAEDIIREQVKLLYKRHKNTAFSWLRNIFHDCAVESCDASLLLDSTRRSLSEKETDRSFGLRNFRYLDTIKEAVERECPEVVSCADILVISARDGIVAVGGPYIPLKTGRRDGRRSRAEILEQYLPDHNESISVVLDKFAAMGIDTPGVVALLGVPGFAAWVGIHLIGNPKSGENVFISAAAGAAGMFAGQLAKLRGCRVVGSAGTDEKVNLLKDEVKFDDAFNYNKESDFDVALSKYFPNGIDVYFDNVGGAMLEAVLNHVNLRARIPLCGMISQYNQVWTERQGVRNLLNMVGKEVRMEGFMIGSYLHHFNEFADEIEGYIREGKLISKFKINSGIESFLPSLVSQFSSSNIGKVIVEVNK